MSRAAAPKGRCSVECRGLGLVGPRLGGRGGCRGLKLENRYCIRVSGSLICGEHNAKKIGAPPP